LVAWAQFVRAAAAGTGSAASGCARRLDPAEAFAHGAYLTLLDGLGLGLGLPEETAKGLARACKEFLIQQLPATVGRVSSDCLPIAHPVQANIHVDIQAPFVFCRVLVRM
jgi:midasin